MLNALYSLTINLEQKTLRKRGRNTSIQYCIKKNPRICRLTQFNPLSKLFQKLDNVDYTISWFRSKSITQLSKNGYF